MKHPYEVLLRWDPETGVFRGAHVRWSDMSLQPLHGGAGGFPLADVLSTVQIDALAVNEQLRADILTIQGQLADSAQALAAAVSARDTAVAELDALRTQLAEQAAAAAASVPAHHLRRALRDAGLRDRVEALIAGLPADHPLRDDWEYAPHIRRDAQGIEQVRVALGLTHEQVDAIFQAAAAVRT